MLVPNSASIQHPPIIYQCVSALNERGRSAVFSCPPAEPQYLLIDHLLRSNSSAPRSHARRKAWAQILKSCHNPGPVFRPPKRATLGGEAVLTTMHSDPRDAKPGCIQRLYKAIGPRSPVRKGPRRVRLWPVGIARAAVLPRTPQVPRRGAGGGSAAGQDAGESGPRASRRSRPSPRPAVRPRKLTGLRGIAIGRVGLNVDVLHAHDAATQDGAHGARFCRPAGEEGVTAAVASLHRHGPDQAAQTRVHRCPGTSPQPPPPAALA